MSSVDLHSPRHRSMRARVLTVSIMAAAILTAVVAWRAAHPVRTYDAAVTGEVLVSADGRTITTAVMWTPCENRPRLVARESGQGVTLALRREDHATEGMVCDDATNKLVSVPLSTPIGSRSLTDAVSGRPIAFFDARRLASPRYLPAGYTQVDGGVADTTRQSTPPVTPPSWTRLYEGDEKWHGNLEITQSAGKSPDTTGATVTVNGHPAYLQEWPSPDNPVSRTLTWSDSDNTFTVAVSTARGQMSKDEFMKVAAGLD